MIGGVILLLIMALALVVAFSCFAVACFAVARSSPVSSPSPVSLSWSLTSAADEPCPVALDPPNLGAAGSFSVDRAGASPFGAHHRFPPALPPAGLRANGLLSAAESFDVTIRQSETSEGLA